MLLRSNLHAFILAATFCGLAGCGPVASLFNDARITAITPGQSINGGDLDCWLTLEFDEVPSGIDPQDIKVRFESIALVEPSEFDWSYIAWTYAAEEMKNPFGYKALCTKALAMGVLGVHWLDSSKEVIQASLPLPQEDLTLKHRADYDARYQAEILIALLDRMADR